MELLWARQGAASVRDVLETLSVSDRRPAYTTVMTVLDNLYRKGWLSRELDGRAFRYQPTSAREDYVAELMREALTGSDDHAAVMQRFAERLTEDELRALRSALRLVARGKS